jgi:hypothetical protein
LAVNPWASVTFGADPSGDLDGNPMTIGVPDCIFPDTTPRRRGELGEIGEKPFAVISVEKWGKLLADDLGKLVPERIDPGFIDETDDAVAAEDLIGKRQYGWIDGFDCPGGFPLLEGV